MGNRQEGKVNPRKGKEGENNRGQPRCPICKNPLSPLRGRGGGNFCPFCKEKGIDVIIP